MTAKSLGRFLAYVPLTLWAMIIILPLYWTIITSFKLPVAVTSGITYLPWVDFTPSLQAWKDVFGGEIQVLDPMKNSLLAASVSSVVAVALGSMAAYGLVRFRYRWGHWRNDDIAFWFVSQRMLPPAAIVLAFIVMYNYLGMLDTVVGLTIAYTGFNLPFAVWIMRDFFAALPRELEEAARVDGAGWGTTFLRIVLPLSVPGLAATTILLFIFSWNEYLFASLLAFEQAKTLPVTIAGMATSIGVRWWSISALSLISMVPTIILGLMVQRYIVRGLTSGAIK
jgi:multiple sugar transport system permease protein